jgi:glycolate oxidase FAD binding subunit
MVDALLNQIQTHTALRIAGAGTKRAAPGDVLRAPSGVIDYQPDEFVIQAYAGTPVAEIVSLLAERGQYLPFDPLLVETGATLGGTVASNASGPERFRYGGVRDFIIGCHFIDGHAELLTGGGKVVKNAAGFDYPKLFVGSKGSLGMLVDVAFKVFPKPESYLTLVAPFASLADAIAGLHTLTAAPLDLHALDIAVDAAGARIETRIGGLRGGLAARVERVRALIGGEVLADEAEAAHWSNVREFGWLNAYQTAVKVPITPVRAAAVDALCLNTARRYSVGGNVAWLAVEPPALTALDSGLRALGLSAEVFYSPDPAQRTLQRLGASKPNPFADLVRKALDPHGKFSKSNPVLAH